MKCGICKADMEEKSY